MSGVREEVLPPAEHNPLSVENALEVDREDRLAPRARSGCVSTGRGIWGAGDHHPHLGVPQWNAVAEAA